MPSSRPRIGITCGYRVKDVSRGVPRIEIGSNYTDAVIAAGGLPILIVPREDDGHAEEYAQLIDGLLLTGGPDVPPARYGAEPHPETKPMPAVRDHSDLAVFHAVRRAGKPILGICLGHQQVNVALGGTLLQHLPDAIQPYRVEHRAPSLDAPLAEHEVEIVPGTRLAALLGRERLEVNSSHHQGIGKIAPGLRPAARAADGLVESLESEEGDQILTIQWHPEFLIAKPEHFAVFKDLVARARRSR